MRNFKHLKLIVMALMLFVMALNLAHPIKADEEEDQKVVRVGWFDSSFCYFDAFGRRCGIAYEYQHKIAAYTGWTYEYVEDSWPNLFQMLKEGKIDLLSDVSYKPERTEYMSFPDLPMGAESYYIYIDANNREITADNLDSFKGKRIGVNQGSVQEGFLKEWAEKNNIDIEIVSLLVEEDESMDMVTNGEIDGYTSIYTFSSEQKVIPVVRVGSSDYFYAVNKNRPDLLAELNMALAGIQDEDPYFNQRLQEERLYNTRTNAFLTPSQEDWLEKNGTIRIGYRDDYLPFCDADDETGELTGALKDYLAHASNGLRSSGVQFEAVPYSSTSAAIDAMKNDEVDCVFPVYLSSYDSEETGVWLTNPAMKTEMNAIVKALSENGLSRDSSLTFAVDADSMNIDTFIMDKYPASNRKTFDDTRSCFEAISSASADCVLLSNYRLSEVHDLMNRYKLYSIPTGEALPLSFAVDRDDRDLYFLLNKTVLITSSEDMDAALASYMESHHKVSFSQFLKDNWLGVIAAVSAVFMVINVLLVQKLQAEKKVNEQQKMMEDALRRELQHKEQLQSAMDMAYRDPLTGVKSKHAYNEAADQMDRRIIEKDVSEFSVVVFDLNDLKQINDSKGHETGDEYIKDACKLICSCFKHSPIYRIGGDEFTAILEGEDYDNQDELLDSFKKQILKNIENDGTVVAFGCSRFEPGKDTMTRSVFERADARMYVEKQQLKKYASTVK